MTLGPMDPTADHGVAGPPGPAPTLAGWRSTVRDAVFGDPANVRGPSTVADALLLTRGKRRTKLTTFAVLLVLSAVIAAGGVLTDSTATVIGAMIVAPLGTVILAVALSIVIGRTRLVWINLGLLAAAALVVILIGWLAAATSLLPIDATTNTQILGRASPQLADLFVAIATGLVGSYALTRADLNDVLPGVAIAISLVPPLVVVGVCLHEATYAQGLGSLLLFLANVGAMVLSGSIVFTLAGYGRAAAVARAGRRTWAIIGVTAAITLLFLALAITTLLGFARQQTLDAATDAADAWANDNALVVLDTAWTGNSIDIRVLGQGAPPDEAPLLRAIEADALLPAPITVEFLVGTRLGAPAEDDGPAALVP
jgi:uncharacterized hydrophobic protein (TIGR00271 family)